MKSSISTDKLPAVIDMDRTLLVDDALELAFLSSLRKSVPHSLYLCLRLLPTSLLKFKHRIFDLADLNVDDLVFLPEVLDLVAGYQKEGREIWLVTASPQSIATAVGARISIPPTRIVGSTLTNLKGAQKARWLSEHFGHQGFVYVGDSYSDLHVWRVAASAIVVNGSSRLLRRIESLNVPIQRIESGRGRKVSAWGRLIRPHQWVKNVLIFCPILAAHQWGSLDVWVGGILAFTAFCLAASGTYLLNDALDWSSDRHHPKKRHRPVAAGAIRPAHAILVGAMLIALCAAVSLTLPAGASLCCGMYVITTCLYSFWLKKTLLIDTVVLSSLYTLRIVTGGQATEIHLSPWLLSFSCFTFFSLAMLKRYSELKRTSATNSMLNTSRGYSPEDTPVVQILGIGSGVTSCLVLSLYLINPDVSDLYSQPLFLTALPILFFYWIGRLWLLSNRGYEIEDPVRFATRDGPSWLIVLLVLATIIIGK